MREGVEDADLATGRRLVWFVIAVLTAGLAWRFAGRVGMSAERADFEAGRILYYADPEQAQSGLRLQLWHAQRHGGQSGSFMRALAATVASDQPNPVSADVFWFYQGAFQRIDPVALIELAHVVGELEKHRRG